MRARETMPAILALAFMMTGCTSQPAPAEKAAEAPKPAVTADAQVQKYRGCWMQFNAKDWDTFKSCYGASIVDEVMDSGRPAASGIEAAVAEGKGFYTPFPDGSGSPTLILATKDHIAALATITGTHTGPLPGPDGKPIPPTNKKVGWVMGHAVDVEDLAIVKERQYGDGTTQMAQLGLIKAPVRPVMTGGGSPIVVVATGSDAEKANVETYRANIAAFNAHDPKALAAMNASDAVFHDYTQAKDVDGAGNVAIVSAFFKGFSDAKLDVPTIWAAGDYVVTEGTFSGTNTGAMPMMGIKKATGKAASVHFLEITKIEGGKIKEDWLVFDSMAFGKQLGL